MSRKEFIREFGFKSEIIMVEKLFVNFDLRTQVVIYQVWKRLIISYSFRGNRVVIGDAKERKTLDGG